MTTTEPIPASPTTIIFINEIGDDDDIDRIDLSKKGFVEIAYHHSLDNIIQDYSINFYNEEGTVISSKNIPSKDNILKEEQQQQNNYLLTFVRYNSDDNTTNNSSNTTNNNIHAFAIVKKEKDELIQFVSLGDTIIKGSEGPVTNIESKFFGRRNLLRRVQENSSSVGLIGEGCIADSFTQVEMRPTPGQINPGQTFGNCTTIISSEQPTSVLTNVYLSQMPSQFPSTFQFPSQMPSMKGSIAAAIPPTPSTSTSRNFNPGPSIGIAGAVLVVVSALFIGRKYYSSGRRNDKEEMYIAGDIEDNRRMVGFDTETRPDQENNSNAVTSIKSTKNTSPQKPIPILKQSKFSNNVVEASVISNTHNEDDHDEDESSTSTASTVVRAISLMSSSKLYKLQSSSGSEDTEISNTNNYYTAGPGPTEWKTIRPDDAMSESTSNSSSTAMRTRSLMSKSF